jgi:hypothetical protein
MRSGRAASRVEEDDAAPPPVEEGAPPPDEEPEEAPTLPALPESMVRSSGRMRWVGDERGRKGESNAGSWNRIN